LDVHVLDPSTAATLSIAPDGAILVRPDAQIVARWPTAPTEPAAELAGWTGSRWFERLPVRS
jgi:hypothetical protein